MDYKQFVGKKYSSCKEELQQSSNVRLWYPGSIGTMDYNPSRLNVYINEKDIIYKVNFG